MDDAMRGFIEKQIDNVLKKEVFPWVEWMRDEIPISLRDVMIGFLVGTLQIGAETSVILSKRRVGQTTEEEEDREIREIIKRRLPEIVEKIDRELNR